MPHFPDPSNISQKAFDYFAMNAAEGLIKK